MPREFMLVHRAAARAARLGVWPIGLDAAHDPMTLVYHRLVLSGFEAEA